MPCPWAHGWVGGWVGGGVGGGGGGGGGGGVWLRGQTNANATTCRPTRSHPTSPPRSALTHPPTHAPTHPPTHPHSSPHPPKHRTTHRLHRVLEGEADGHGPPDEAPRRHDGHSVEVVAQQPPHRGTQGLGGWEGAVGRGGEKGGGRRSRGGGSSPPAPPTHHPPTPPMHLYQRAGEGDVAQLARGGAEAAPHVPHACGWVGGGGRGGHVWTGGRGGTRTHARTHTCTLTL